MFFNSRSRLILKTLTLLEICLFLEELWLLCFVRACVWVIMMAKQARRFWVYFFWGGERGMVRTSPYFLFSRRKVAWKESIAIRERLFWFYAREENFSMMRRKL